MPQIVETTVYQLNELDEAGRDKARNWYREQALFVDWHESVHDDFESICSILGVELKRRTVPFYGGGTGTRPCIYFSGFWSQDDGACFEARYAYAKRAWREIRQHAPQDTHLHKIADALQAVQHRNFYQLTADVIHRGRYTHEYCMSISVDRDSPTAQEFSTGADDVITEALRELARWLYRQLEREYEFQTSDDIVDESILANEYTFTESGRRFG